MMYDEFDIEDVEELNFDEFADEPDFEDDEFDPEEDEFDPEEDDELEFSRSFRGRFIEDHGEGSWELLCQKGNEEAYAFYHRIHLDAEERIAQLERELRGE